MSDGRGFEVVVSSGSLRPAHGVVMPHRWTPEGVVVETEFTGLIAVVDDVAEIPRALRSGTTVSRRPSS